METPFHRAEQPEATPEPQPQATPDAVPASSQEVSAHDAYTGKDLDIYHVLLAVERGELSQVEAARKLDELDEPPSTEDSDAAGTAI